MRRCKANPFKTQNAVSLLEMLRMAKYPNPRKKIQKSLTMPKNFKMGPFRPKKRLFRTRGKPKGGPLMKLETFRNKFAHCRKKKIFRSRQTLNRRWPLLEARMATGDVNKL